MELSVTWIYLQLLQTGRNNKDERKWLLGMDMNIKFAAFGLVMALIALIIIGGFAEASELNILSTSMEGSKFTASTEGLYKITIVGGAFTYSIYWDTILWKCNFALYINKPVQWGAADQWGLHPINWDMGVGVPGNYLTFNEAEAAGLSKSGLVHLNKDEYIIAIISDGSNYYHDNSGMINVSIEKVDSPGDSNWTQNPTNGHYYKLIAPMNWLDAEARATNLGGHLVTINDRQEELWLRDQFGANELFWLGFNDIRMEGNWEWVSGEPTTYRNWAQGEPNNKAADGRPENGSVMNWDHYQNNIVYFGDRWNDVPTNGLHRGIIETSSPGVPGDMDSNGKVDDLELLAYIQAWANGNASDLDLLAAIANWDTMGTFSLR